MPPFRKQQSEFSGRIMIDFIMRKLLQNICDLKMLVFDKRNDRTKFEFSLKECVPKSKEMVEFMNMIQRM